MAHPLLRSMCEMDQESRDAMCRQRGPLHLDSFADWLDRRGATTQNREPLMDQLANLRQAVFALDMPRRPLPLRHGGPPGQHGRLCAKRCWN